MSPCGALRRSQTWEGCLRSIVHHSHWLPERGASSLLSLPSSKHLRVCSASMEGRASGSVHTTAPPRLHQQHQGACSLDTCCFLPLYRVNESPRSRSRHSRVGWARGPGPDASLACHAASSLQLPGPALRPGLYAFAPTLHRPGSHISHPVRAIVHI